MEDYNKNYPEVPKEDKIYPEAPKNGKTFRLKQSCRVLENLEKEAKHYASVRKKYKRCLNVLSRISTSTGTLSFCLSGSGVGTAFSGVGLPLAASLGGLGLICGVVSVIAGEAGKKVSRKVTKHEKTVSVYESKINSLKDRISKALADDMLSDEEFENILAEMGKYHEMKKDIRHNFQKKQGQKNSECRRSQSITPTDSCRNTQKTGIQRRPPKIEASCFCFLRSGSEASEANEAGEACYSYEISLRPPPYNPDFNFVSASF